MVWRPAAVAVVLLLAGCLTKAHADAGEGPGLADAADAAARPPGPATWYLHRAPTGQPGSSGQPTCATVDPYLDQEDTAGDCESGQRMGGSPLSEAPCDDLCFPSRGPGQDHAAGSQVDVRLFLTTDAVDIADVTLRLVADGAQVGAAEVRDVTLFGHGGLTYQEVALGFALERPVRSDALLELRVQVDVTESYFIGFEGDHASRLTITPPA